MQPLLFVLLLLFRTEQDDPQKVGLQALDKGDYRLAAQTFSAILQADPKDYAAAFNLALAETQLHEDQQAIADYRKTLALKPNLYEAELNLGILLLRNKQPGEALPLLQDAVQQRPKEARPKRYLADSLAATGDVPKAAAAYAEALQIDPKMAPAELGLGQSLLQQGKLDEAKPHYRSAAALDPQLHSYLLELAQALARAGKSPDAIALLQEFPSDPAAQEELGRLYLVSNQPEQAVAVFQSVMAQSPTPANRLALAEAYLKNNQPAKASPLLEAALASTPNDYDLRMVVGRIRRDQHQYRNAAEDFIAAASLRSTSVEAWNEAATAFVLSEQYPQAIAALDKVRGLNAETAGNYYYRAICFDKLHQKKPAIASYQRFLELSGGKYPDQEFNARQRSKTLEHEVNR